MLILDTPQRKLEVALAAPVVASSLPFNVYYQDYTGPDFVAGTFYGTISGEIPALLLSPPVGQRKRYVSCIIIRNADTVTHTVTVRYADYGPSTFSIISINLSSGDMLQFNDGEGWKVMNSSGAFKNTGEQGPQGIPGNQQLYTTGEAIGSPRAVMLVAGEVFLFDPSVEGNVYKLVGVTLTAANLGDPITVIDSGELASAGAFVQDTVYYAGAAGVLTAIPPTLNLTVKIGIAKDANTLIVGMSDPIVLV